jgi:hypothetical protein
VLAYVRTDGEIDLAVLDEEGNVTLSAFEVTDTTGAITRVAVAHGLGSALVLGETSGGAAAVWAVPVDGALDVQDPLQVRASASIWPDGIASSGDDHLVVTRDGDEYLLFRLTRTAEMSGDPIPVQMTTCQAESPRLVWTGDGYGLVYTDTVRGVGDREVFLVRYGCQ